ncbi:MAG: response regulator [Polyangia bacterium]
MSQGKTPACVLVVEDDAWVRRMVVKWIERTGARVHAAEDGVEAMRILQQDRLRPDVILLDAEMPQLDGFGLLRLIALQPELAAIPCIMMSAGDPAWAARAHSLGAVDYLAKPFGPIALITTLAPYCGKAHTDGLQSA